MIYFDNNATTPLADEVQTVYGQALSEFGNASSVHRFGQRARRLVNESREKIADLLKVKEKTLTFTSGGTEALNTALLGVLLPGAAEKHCIVSAVEHGAVLETVRFLTGFGMSVTYLPVDAEGRLDPEQVAAALRPETALIAVMLANNETGNLYPIHAIGQIAREHGVFYLCDGVQAMGKLPLDLSRLPVDFLAASAHKFHGPKGVGLLYTREGIEIEPLIHGGRQERGQRAGTENVAGMVAMAHALELADSRLFEDERKVGGLRDQLQQGLLGKIPTARVLGDLEHRLYNTLNLSIPGISGEAALMNLDLAGVAISIGAACESGSVEPSHVLKAMGYSDEVASSGLRFSLSRYNTAQEVEEALRIIPEVVERVRATNP